MPGFFIRNKEVFVGVRFDENVIFALCTNQFVDP